MTECPEMLPDGIRQEFFPLPDGSTIEVHAPDWVPIPLPVTGAVRCQHCPRVHVGHDPTESQHAQHRPPDTSVWNGRHAGPKSHIV